MSGYIESEIVEANRLTSEEARTNNDSNPAQWTCVLGDIYDLNPGDKVSLYSAFISERGAGTSKTIEIKGRTLGKTKTFKYIKETVESEKVTNRKVSAVVEQITDTKELRDNIANLTICYYKNTNGTGYATLPRKGIPTGSGEANSAPAEPTLSQVGVGFLDGEDICPIPKEATPFIIKGDYYRVPYGSANPYPPYDENKESVVRVNNDNSKFTLFISRFSNLGNTEGAGLINGGLAGSTEPALSFTIEPEFREYYLYRELLEIEVEKGFNSAQFIAQSLTNKLQLITKTEDLIFSPDPTQIETGNNSANIHISKTIESNTYKTFNCATSKSMDFLEEPTENPQYYNAFQVVGMKRPELYETGQFINMNAGTPSGDVIPTTSDRLLGSQLRQDFDTNVANEPFRTNIPYTLENLNLLKEFINAQELYPEIWESWNAPQGSDESAFTYGDGSFYNEDHTVDNTRFFHMNQQQNARQIEIDASATVETTTSARFLIGGSATDNAVFFATRTPDMTTSINTRVTIPSIGLTDIPATVEFSGIGQEITLNQNLGTTVPAGTDYTIKHYTNADISPYSMLGSSLMRNSIYSAEGSDEAEKYERNLKRYSKLFLVYYNKADRDVFYDKPSLERNELTYGCFGKESYTHEGVVGDFINIYPHVVKTGNEPGAPFNMVIPDWFYESSPIEASRKFGYDLHFTAPTQPAILLWEGSQITMVNYYGETFSERFVNNKWENSNFKDDGSVEFSVAETEGYINRRYIGADNPKVLWDGEHFKFSDLHTSENLASRGPDGGRYALDLNPTGGAVPGGTSGIFLTADIPSDEGGSIYKLNPLQDINEWCPAILPYQQQFKMFSRNGSAAQGPGEMVVSDFNKNYQPYTVYDSRSGIFFEDMGYDADTWDDGLWGIMGFSYDQFNATENNLLKRVDNTNINSLKYPTTNADIKATNTKNWVTNIEGIPHFGDTMPAPFSYYMYNENGSYEFLGDPRMDNIPAYPPINIKCSSISLTAESFPVSMIRGYYTVRSDIVPRSIFVGGRDNITNMPIVGVVNKENPQSDYYFGGQSDIQFTIGKPTKLSSITVGIFDPDGSYANVNDSSSVLFKIEREVRTSFNVIDEILGDKNKAKI